MEKNEAYKRVKELADTLNDLVKRDPDTEVHSFAVPAIDAVTAAAAEHLGADDPMVARLHDIVSPDAIESGEQVMASDALIVVRQLEAALRPPPAKSRASRVHRADDPNRSRRV